jgi:hypothetical protein
VGESVWLGRRIWLIVSLNCSGDLIPIYRTCTIDEHLSSGVPFYRRARPCT